MTRRFLWLFAALAPLLLGGTCSAQAIKLPATLQVDTPGLVIVRATELDADDVRFFAVGKPALQTFPPDVLQAKTGVFVGITTQPGTYKIGAVCAKTVNGKAVISQPVFCTITVGTPTPVPPGPNPPGPNPPGPAPIPDAGLHVLLIYDSAKLTGLPAKQLEVLEGDQVRQYLNGKCAQVGGKADWGIWPDGGDASAYPSAPLRAMYARKRSQAPWVVISKDGQAGFEGPLPADVPSMMALLQKYGG